MISILFLVGKDNDYYPLKYTSKNAPKWLKHIEDFKDFINEEEHKVPADVAMAMYLAYHHPKDHIRCLFAFETFSKKLLDPYDVVFVIHGPTEVFLCGGKTKTCPSDMKKFERALKTTSAVVYPYPELQKYIVIKPTYYADLSRAGIPIVPFFKAIPSSVLKNVAQFKTKIERKNWKGVIVKPSYGGFSTGSKVYKNIARTKVSTIKKNFERVRDLGFPSAVIQEFVPSFSQHFEIRTYWINGKYAFSTGTLTKALGGDGLPLDDIATFVSEGGKLPDRVKTKLKMYGKEVMKALPQYPYPNPMLRIDFGCCIDTSEECRDNYFVNEVETMTADMLPSYTKYPVVENVAKAAYKFAKEVKGKKGSIKPKMSKYIVEHIPCARH